jgi:AraC-like DNA-binding protein
MWRADDLGGLELFSATLSEFAFRPHAHEEFFIALTEHGLCMPAYRGHRHEIGPGDLIVLNPEEAHAGGPPSGVSWSYRSLYVRPELFGEFVPHFRVDVIRDRDVAARLGRFHQLSERPGSSVLQRESLLAGALGLLAARHAAPSAGLRSPGTEPAAVRLSREYLEEHATEQVTLQALSRIAGLSAFHLCRVFATAVGMPPHAYQTQVRVRRARSLLRTGLPISQVAVATGFTDQAHLTRHFKRIVGLTPGRYIADL